jgi:3-aminobutyryl-CoA ammonia-lyase
VSAPAPGEDERRQEQAVDPRVGLTVTHRRYVPYAHTHYGGNLVDGAYVLSLFGDVATEVCVRGDGDEGLFASYSDVQFVAPVRAGDILETTATVVRVGRRSRVLEFEARVLCRARAKDSGGGTEGEGSPSPVADSAAEVLDPPVLAVTATGTVVVPRRNCDQRNSVGYQAFVTWSVICCCSLWIG